MVIDSVHAILKIKQSSLASSIFFITEFIFNNNSIL